MADRYEHFTDTMIKELQTADEKSDCLAFTFRPGFYDWYKNAKHDFTKMQRLFGESILASIKIYIVNPQTEDFIFWDNKENLADYLEETDSK